MESIIEISNLTVSFPVIENWLKAIDGINLSVNKGETLAIIGESGSGKSILGLSILKLLPENTRIEGTINFKEKNLLNLPEHEIETIRGKRIAWISQNPKTGFNPTMKMWKQVAEPPVIHSKLSWSDAKKHAENQLKRFNILPASFWCEEYPVTYSGGMLQRAMISMGTSLKPEVLIADEPTKGIDRINKNDIIKTFSELKNEGITLLLITHDLDFAAELADRIVVMYCGQIVEIIGIEAFYKSSRHPYTHGLINSLPQNGMHPIPGSAPPMQFRVSGCRFKDRCKSKNDLCNNDIPLFFLKGDYVRCNQYNNCERTF
jgi:peptide/nickel transport system ATP-binding protein